MARGNFPQQVFNRGRISVLGLARTDLDRTRLSAEIQTNWMPRTLGSMMVRPGLQYIGQTRSNLTCRLIPFVFSATDTALLEVTNANTRIWIDDALLTRSIVSASATNGTFDSNLTGWTDADQSGADSTWKTGGYMSLTGTRFSAAIRRQAIAVPATDASVEHGVRIVVNRGLPNVKIGSADGNDDYVAETALRPGVHSFAVTPSSNIYIELSANTEYASLIDSVAIETTGGVLALPSTWAAADLNNMRWAQSADVIFLAAVDLPQKRIERHATRSWSIVDYTPEDGPFRNPNTSLKRLTPSGLTGDITLSCDNPLFDANHVGALFRITSIGQQVKATLTGGNQYTDTIRVSGVGNSRSFDILITQSTGFSATIDVQRSIGEDGSYTDVSGLSYTSTQDTSHSDGLDNQIAFYRIGSASTKFVSGTAFVTLTYAAGGITGVAKINSVTSSTLNASTESSASVLIALGSTVATDTWSEGDWSKFRGYPSSVVFHEGRLWWAGKSKIWGSVSDAFESFDPDTEGDSGPLNRSIASGPVDRIQWLQSLTRLLVGTEGREIQAKTSSLEEPLTPTNFNLRDISTQGSANVQAVKIDNRALFVQQAGSRVYEVGVTGDSLDFGTADRTVLVPEIGEPSISRMAVQRQPDTRVHCVRGTTDGTVGVLVSDPAEDVTAWVDVYTGDANGVNGVVEDVAVLPGTIEDKVYYVVKREINGSTVRYLEKWAKESEARGGSTNKMADSFSSFSSSLGSTTVTGADHLVGQTVTAWGSASSGVHLGSTFVVSTTGTFQIPSTLATDSTTVYYGLGYTAWYKTAKLAYGAQAGSALTQAKKVSHLGVIAANIHAQGLRYGRSTSTAVAPLDPLPIVVDGVAVSTDKVHQTYDQAAAVFDGSWNTDSRVVLKGIAPRPATVLGLVMEIETKEKI